LVHSSDTFQRMSLKLVLASIVAILNDAPDRSAYEKSAPATLALPQGGSGSWWQQGGRERKGQEEERGGGGIEIVIGKAKAKAKSNLK
jgi:hypothetical protein